MPAAPQRRRSRAMLANIVIVAIIVALAPVAVVAVVWWQTGATPEFLRSSVPQLPPPNTAEMIIIQPGQPAETQAEYSDAITLVIEGNLLQTNERRRDLFYIHSDEFGLPLDAPISAEPLLLINGRPPAERPDYNPFHVYQLQHTNTDAPAPIRFDIVADDITAGQMRVFIVPQ